MWFRVTDICTYICTFAFVCPFLPFRFSRYSGNLNLHRNTNREIHVYTCIRMQPLCRSILTKSENASLNASELRLLYLFCAVCCELCTAEKGEKYLYPWWKTGIQNDIKDSVAYLLRKPRITEKLRWSTAIDVC